MEECPAPAVQLCKVVHRGPYVRPLARGVHSSTYIGLRWTLFVGYSALGNLRVQ